jgi:hypothetical protein
MSSEAEMSRMNPQDDRQLGVVDHMAGSDVTAIGYLSGRKRDGSGGVSLG